MITNFLNQPLVIATVPVFIVGMLNLISIFFTWYLNKKSIKASESNIVNKIDSLIIFNSKTEQNNIGKGNVVHNGTGPVNVTKTIIRGDVIVANLFPIVGKNPPNEIFSEIIKNQAK